MLMKECDDMDQNLITQRLILKSISDEDREFVFTEFSDAVITKYLYDQEPLNDIKQADEIIHTYTCPQYEGLYRWILVRKTDNRKMGTCGFHCFNKREGTIEIGYDLQADFCGHGYMQEALKEIIVYGMENMPLKQIHAHIFVGNEKSIALSKKLGFINSKKTYNYTLRSKDYLHLIYSLDCSSMKIVK
jgi:ribosomal-protein-alanine N-acetyltransferase